MPGLAIVMFAALVTYDLSPMLLALGGALTVGFGSFKKLTNNPLLPMFIVGAGMGLSAGIGSLVGNSFWVFCVAAASLAALCALMSAIDDALWWITLQWVITFMVAGYYPVHLEGAVFRSGWILAGSAVEITTFACFTHFLVPHQQRIDCSSFKSNLIALQNNLITQFHVTRHGLYTAFLVFLCLIIVHKLDLQHGYWAPMTSLVVIKAHPRETLQRAGSRLLGTLGGCVLTTVIGMFNVGVAVLGAIGLACAFMAYASQEGRYSLFTFFITATVVTTVRMNGIPEWQASLERIMATCIGGGLAVLVLSAERCCMD